MAVVSATVTLRESKCWRQARPAASQRNPSAHPDRDIPGRLRPGRAYLRFSRPTYASKSQLLIQIIRTPPLCLQKSTFPGLPTINPDGPKNQRTQSTQSRAIALGYFMCILVAARMLDLQDIARCPASFRRITSPRIPLAKNCRTSTELDLEPVRRAEIEQPTRSRI